MNEGYKLIIDYHKNIMAKDPIAGQELIKANEKHLEKAIQVLQGEQKRRVPISVINKKKKKKHRN